MAIGKASDFKVYQEYFQSRANELLAQNGNAFNAASAGAIRLTTVSRRGDYAYNAFFSNISGIATRRDTTSVATATDLAMAQQDIISVKLSRKLGPIGQTRDAFRKAMARYSETEFSGILGEQAGNAMQIEMLNTALLAGRAALKQQSTSYFTQSSLGSMDTNTLVDGLAKLGDQAGRVICWVMHSKPYYDLVKQQITANITGVSNFAVANATPVTLNRPVIVTDSASLIAQLNSPDVNDYYTLGLVEGAIQVENTEEQELVIQDVTGLENLVVRYQGEYAFNLGVKGFQWDTGNGGVNPTGTAVGTGTNWDAAYSDVKDRAGVAIMTL